MKLAFENRLNVLLSDLFCQLGIISRAEFLGKDRRDIVIYHQGLAIVLEGSYSRQDAENDAKKRIEQLDTDIAIAIHYPSIFPQELGENEIRQKLRDCHFPVRMTCPPQRPCQWPLVLLLPPSQTFDNSSSQRKKSSPVPSQSRFKAS